MREVAAAGRPAYLQPRGSLSSPSGLKARSVCDGVANMVSRAQPRHETHEVILRAGGKTARV